MTLESLKRTNASIVVLRKFLQRVSIDDPNKLAAHAISTVRPLLQEYNQHPVLTYQRLKNFLDDFDGDLKSVRCLSLMIVIGKAHHYSDTALERALAGLLAAERINLNTQQSTKLPGWIINLSSRADAQRAKPNNHSDIFLISLSLSLSNRPVSQVLHSYTQTAFSLELGLAIAAYLGEGISSKSKSKVTELDCLSQLIDKAPELQGVVSPLLSPTSAFWARFITKVENSGGFILCSTATHLLVAQKTVDTDRNPVVKTTQVGQDHIYSSALSKSQVSFKVWFSTLLNALDIDNRSDQLALPTYPIQRPPASLLKIIHALHKPKTEPTELASLISQSSFFSHTLQRSAQQLNRMGIPVADVKQSILTHGMERVGIILTEQVLWSRLIHAKFPLLRQFENIVELHRFVAASIAQISKSGLPQQASLLATFQLSFLFTHPPLRLRTSWNDKQKESDSPGSLFENIDNTLPLQSAQALATAWHQPADMIKTLRYFNNGSKDRAVQTNISCLKLSLLLTRHWLAGKEFQQSELKKHLANYPSLRVTLTDIANIRTQSAEFLYCTLN